MQTYYYYSSLQLEVNQCMQQVWRDNVHAVQPQYTLMSLLINGPVNQVKVGDRENVHLYYFLSHLKWSQLLFGSSALGFSTNLLDQLTPEAPLNRYALYYQASSSN